MGFALPCNEIGAVEEILCNDDGIACTEPIGKLLTSLVADDARPLGASEPENDIRNLNLLQKTNNKQANTIHSFIRINYLFFNGRMELAPLNFVLPTKNIPARSFLPEPNYQESRWAFSVGMNIFLMAHFMNSKFSKNPSPEVDKRHYFEEIQYLNNDFVNLQRQLAKQDTELAMLNEMKIQFQGITAHDMRNAISVILMIATFLEEDTHGVIEKEQEEFLDNISSSATFMLRLIEDLPEISKIESGKLKFNLTELNLNALITETVKLYQVLVSKKIIHISFTEKGEPFDVKVDRLKIEQVMNNLLSNTIKYTNPDGTNEVTLNLDHQRAIVHVADKGTGIPEHKIAEPLIPFRLIAPKGTGGEKGTGLGLAITKKSLKGMVEKYGSKVFLEREPHLAISFQPM